MNSNNQLQNLKEEEKFEQELVQSLRYYGYLFPESVEDVQRFEALYGNTEIDIPEHLDSLENIKFNNEPQLDFGLSYNTAAFSSNDQNDFELPDDLDLNNIEQKKDKPE